MEKMVVPAARTDKQDIAFEVLDAIQHRVLWLATRMVHEANHLRPNPDGIKVGGHQASSASAVSILTLLYLHFMKAGDAIAVKPHASPVFHALHYLLGRLPRDYLPRLRAYGGLQAYPSQTKDPVPVDFSTGSVGLGAVAPAMAALADDYVRRHFGGGSPRRWIALVGDAELDEGNVWEAVVEQALHGLGNLLWIVDLNRQSLDRVVPGIRAAQLKELFTVSGWQVLEAKYGRRLQRIFARPGGERLRTWIDEMSNEEYQSLYRRDGTAIRRAIERAEPALLPILEDVPDKELPALLGDLGGHDLVELHQALARADAAPDRPTVIFAYTIKGWGLPIAGDPLNHSALLTQDQIDALRDELGIPADDDWAAFPPDSPEARLCAEAAARLWPARPVPAVAIRPEEIPERLDVHVPAETPTQHAFGRVLVRLADLPRIGERIVTTSPDVSISTNLAGWINKTGVYARHEHASYENGNRTVRWRQGPTGRHIELGISEMNFFMLLSQLGLTQERSGELLFPIGTVYDPFVCRGLDALIYALYTEARFIFAGTPSGITLAPEGGAHQSSVTPSLGLELPNLIAYEPAFANEVEWILLEGLRQCCDRRHGRSTYLRLSTRPVAQALQGEALDRLGMDALRREVLAGGYRLRDVRERPSVGPSAPFVHLAASGAVLPEVLVAADQLEREGVAVNVLALTSPQLLFEGWRDGAGEESHLARLIPPDERSAPIVTIHDAHPHALAWLGSVYGQRVISLGVTGFGQSGSREDLYRHYGLDPDRIVDAALTVLGY